MSSEQRASSAVRNLRSLFENKGTLDPTGSPDSRGRSPSGLGSDKENGGRQTSKVRASFVPVAPVASMAAPADASETTERTARRGSFGEADADLDLRKTISQQQETLGVPDAAIESAAVTPLRKDDVDPLLGQDDSPLGQKGDKPPANPDKPVTAAEEEPSEMKPADPADESAVSGGNALPPVEEDLRGSARTAASSSKNTDAKKPTTNGKPPAISTKAASKAPSSALKSPASQPKTPQSANAPAPAPAKAPVKKASRSSLTAPTAASLAHSRAAGDKGNSKTSPTSLAKKREVTKPINLPSHLTAPTAASRAKHDSESAPTSSTTNLKASTSSRPKQTSSTKPTSRTSLGPQHRPASQTSQNHATRKSLAPADSSFLERMMKPTASSASKTAERMDAKTPPRHKISAPKPKTNGTSVKAAHKPTSAPDLPESVPHPEEAGPVPEEVEEPTEVDAGVQAAATSDGPIVSNGAMEATSSTGDDVFNNNDADHSTPLPNNNDETPDAVLEATPAGITSEEIR